MDIKMKNRTELKSYFRKNSIPTENNFADLIDGMVNQKEDGIVKLPGNPLTIEAAGESASEKKVLLLYQSFGDQNPAWTLSLNARSNPSDPDTAKPGFNISDGEGNSRLFIDRNTGNVGISTTELGISKLKIANSTTDFAHVRFENSGMGQLEIVGWRDGWNINTKTANKHLYLNRDAESSSNVLIGRSGKELFVRGSDGNVGVGTTSPSHQFHVFASNAVGLFESSGTHAYLRLSTKEGLDNRVEIANRPGGRLSLWVVGGGDIFNITRSGNVGIGTTDPKGLLDVNGYIMGRNPYDRNFRDTEGTPSDSARAKEILSEKPNGTFIISGPTPNFPYHIFFYWRGGDRFYRTWIPIDRNSVESF